MGPVFSRVASVGPTHETMAGKYTGFSYPLVIGFILSWPVPTSPTDTHYLHLSPTLITVGV